MPATNVILAITGSISAYKTPWLVRDLRRAGFDVRVVLSPSATQFVTPLALEAASAQPVIVDPFHPSIQDRGSWHVHLAQWADAMLVAPCSATTLARLAHGLCDTAPMTVAMSLPATTPLLVAPAMDSDMWAHPATQHNIAALKVRGTVIIPPETGSLASGLTGQGRLPEHEVLVEALVTATTTPSLHGHNILVTSGPTHEPIDAVRSIVNHASGRMGHAIAAEAAARGANVTLVSGPTSLPDPANVHTIHVTTAAQMATAVHEHAALATIVVMAAAVADFTPARPHDGKLKKHTLGDAPVIELQRTTDILATTGSQRRSGQYIVGFALEHENVVEYATAKLATKNADMIVANTAGIPNSGFGGEQNTITIVTKTNPPASLPPTSKRNCARAIFDAIERHLAQCGGQA
jgi:phosphopantothenoylcysteine decarboxylase/phosphopantothenate--cysteine ligase